MYKFRICLTSYVKVGNRDEILTFFIICTLECLTKLQSPERVVLKSNTSMFVYQRYFFKICISLKTSIETNSSSNASRTFTQRTLAHDWYFIEACQINRPF